MYSSNQPRTIFFIGDLSFVASLLPGFWGKVGGIDTIHGRSYKR